VLKSLLGVPGRIVNGASEPLVRGKVGQRGPRIPPIIEARVVVPTRRFGLRESSDLRPLRLFEHGEVL